MEEYITEEEFFELCQKGITYEGYIIGVGYAFLNVTFGLEYLHPAIRKVSISHYEYLYSQYPVQKSIVCQYIDTSEEQVVKSLEGKKKSVSEGQVVSKNGSSTRNNNVQSSTSKSSFAQMKNNVGLMSMPLQGAERQMPFYKKIGIGIGGLSLTESIYENFIYDSKHYIQTNGKKSVWFKTNKKGAPVYNKNNKLIPKSKEAAKKLARNGRLANLGKTLGGFGIAITAYDISQEGFSKERGFDLTYGVISLLGPWGALIAAPWFIGNTFYSDWQPSEEYLKYCEDTNTD